MLHLRYTEAGFPLAPTQEEWDALSETERDEVVAALPGEVTDADASDFLRRSVHPRRFFPASFQQAEMTPLHFPACHATRCLPFSIR